MSAIAIPGLVKCVTKILRDQEQHYLVYRHQLAPDFILRTYCGLWGRLEDFGAVELRDMPVGPGADIALLQNNLFVAAGGSQVLIQHYRDFEPAGTFSFGTGRNHSVKLAITPQGALAAVSYRQRLTTQDKGVVLDIARLDVAKNAIWVGEVVLDTIDFTMPGAEHILIGPDGLIWIFYIKDGGNAVWLVRLREEGETLQMVDHNAILTQRDGLMSPNGEFPALSLRVNGDHVLIGCPGNQGVGCGVTYVKPFIARIYPDLSKELIKLFDLGVPRHWPPIPLFPNRKGVDALMFATDEACRVPQQFEIYTDSDRVLGEADAKPNTIAWSEDGYFVYQLPDFSAFKLEQLPLRAELKIERDRGRWKISWSPDYPYALQESRSMTDPRWVTISSANPTYVDATGDQRCYRLASNDPAPQLSSPPIPGIRQL